MKRLKNRKLLFVVVMPLVVMALIATACGSEPAGGTLTIPERLAALESGLSSLSNTVSGLDGSSVTQGDINDLQTSLGDLRADYLVLAALLDDVEDRLDDLGNITNGNATPTPTPTPGVTPTPTPTPSVVTSLYSAEAYFNGGLFTPPTGINCLAMRFEAEDILVPAENISVPSYGIYVINMVLHLEYAVGSPATVWTASSGCTGVNMTVMWTQHTSGKISAGGDYLFTITLINPDPVAKVIDLAVNFAANTNSASIVVP